MSDPSLLVAVLAQAQLNQDLVTKPQPPITPSFLPKPNKAKLLYPPVRPHPDNRPEPLHPIEFSTPLSMAPKSGSQLYHQRLAALRAGKLYTRLPSNSFRSFWSRATQEPSYTQWRWLLAQEASSVTKGQGDNRLGILLGDSITLWFPSDRLSSSQFWLNQSISGETTREILQRLSDFSGTRPSEIYLMAGINDLKQGIPEVEILSNLRQIMRQLKQTHPRAQIIVQSILPTDVSIPFGDRVWWLNQELESIAVQEGAFFLDLYSHMADESGNLRRELTTDGLHLNVSGYQVWQEVLLRTGIAIARNS
jgi:lysophospholipase L1-like esterase